MSFPVLTLGPVEFASFEVPSSISFGGRYRIGIHQLANGTRSIDALGADDYDIRFSGIFSGRHAMARAISVDELRTSGIVVPLRWADFLYYVIVRSFSAEYHQSSWIPYKIVCSVVQNETVGSTAMPILAAGSASLDIQEALAVTSLMGNELTPIAQGSTALDLPTLGGLGVDAAQISATVRLLDSKINSLDAHAASCACSSVSTFATDISASYGLLWALVTARGYLSRALTLAADAP
jgi:hypothetical protein